MVFNVPVLPFISPKRTFSRIVVISEAHFKKIPLW